MSADEYDRDSAGPAHARGRADSAHWAKTEAMPIPLYHRVSLVLRQRINTSYYGENGFLPGEHELSAEFGVSRITIARTLSDLAAQGLLSRRRGVGTRVISPPPAGPTNMESLLQNLVAIGTQSKVEVLEFDYVLASATVQQALRVSRTDLVQRAVRVRSAKSQPFGYVTSFVPSALGKTFDAKALGKHPLLMLLERAGAIAVSAQEVVTAIAAEPVVAHALRTEVGQPLIAVERIMYDKQRSPIEFIHALYHPDRYRVQLTLTRQDKTSGPVWSSALADEDTVKSRR